MRFAGLKVVRYLITTIVCLALVLQVKPVRAATPAPVFLIEGVTVSESIVDVGTTFTVKFNLTNNTDDDFEDVYIEIPSTSFGFSSMQSSIMISNDGKVDKRESIQQVTLNLVCKATSSNQIPLKIYYTIAPAGASEAMTTQILVTLAEKSAPVDTTKNKPTFQLTGGDVHVVQKGDSTSLSIKIKNNSSYTAKNVLVSPVISGEYASKLSLNQVNMTPTNVEMIPNAEKTFEFSVTTNGTAPVGSYIIQYHVVYENTSRDVFSAQFSGIVKVTEGATNGNDVVFSQKMTPENPVRDQELSIDVEILNPCTVTVPNFTVWIEGLPSDSFTYLGTTPKLTESLGPQEIKSFHLKYKVAKGAPTGNYAYKLLTSYTDGYGNTIQGEKECLLYLDSADSTKGKLEITGVKIPSNGVPGETDFTVSFDLKNTGEDAIEDIEVNMMSSNEIFAQTASVIQIKELAEGATKKLEFKMMASKPVESKNIPITFQIQYDAKAGDAIEQKSFNQSLGVLIKSEDDTDKTTPKILVTSVTTTPATIVLGTQFDLNLMIQNTNDMKDIHNIKMTLSSVIPSTQMSNIIPIGQSDSLFFDELAVKEEVATSVALLIPTTYTGVICDIRLNFSFEDGDGNIYTDQETVYLPIAEVTQLTASDVRIGKVLEDSYSLEMDFYNTGKGTLKNLMLDLEGDFESTNSNYYVGDLLSGRMDIYSVNINGLPPEQLKGSVVFTYEDNIGNVIEKKVPFDFQYAPEVEEAAVTDINNPEMLQANEAVGKMMGVGLAFIGILVLIAVVVVVIILVRRKRKA